MKPSRFISDARGSSIIIGMLVVVIILLWFYCIYYPITVTTIYIVRHAEKADNSVDPPLSSAGQARAIALAHTLEDESVDAVYVTEFIRTQQTGAPVATSNGISSVQSPAATPQNVIDLIMTDHMGETVLVVAHSTTVDDIATGLGATGVTDLDEDQFDRLFVIHRFNNIVHFERLRYGVETP